jgi:mRNA-degrading endonuclease RelE of RelBE toxin-antitoxin system
MKRIVWTAPSKADVRRLDKPTAMRIFASLHRFAETGEGDVKALHGRDELRLRIADYRLFLSLLLTLSKSAAFSIAAKPTADTAPVPAPIHIQACRQPIWLSSSVLVSDAGSSRNSISHRCWTGLSDWTRTWCLRSWSTGLRWRNCKKFRPPGYTPCRSR